MPYSRRQNRSESMEHSRLLKERAERAIRLLKDSLREDGAVADRDRALGGDTSLPDPHPARSRRESAVRALERLTESEPGCSDQDLINDPATRRKFLEAMDSAREQGPRKAPAASND